MSTKYTVTRKFTAGVLAGLTHTEITSIKWEVGRKVAKPCGGSSPYVIVACVEVAS